MNHHFNDCHDFFRGENKIQGLAMMHTSYWSAARNKLNIKFARKKVSTFIVTDVEVLQHTHTHDN